MRLALVAGWCVLVGAVVLFLVTSRGSVPRLFRRLSPPRRQLHGAGCLVLAVAISPGVFGYRVVNAKVTLGFQLLALVVYGALGAAAVARPRTSGHRAAPPGRTVAP